MHTKLHAHCRVDSSVALTVIENYKTKHLYNLKKKKDVILKKALKLLYSCFLGS